MTILCPQCKELKPCSNGRYNQATRKGLPLYCGRDCAALGSRVAEPISPRNSKWKEIKAKYDREYRAKNALKLKEKKRKYYALTGPLRRDKEREVRKKNMQRHVEYCRRPEYQAYKAEYDKGFRAKKMPAQGDAIAAQAREILRTVKVQLQIVGQSKRSVPLDVIEFAEK
jgi:hypothetical protein